MSAARGSMYRADGDCPDNETLARRVREGGEDAAALLLSRNEGYLTSCAAKLCRQYNYPAMLEDLKQEGALALIDAAQRYDAGHDAQFLTYAGKAIQTAMTDCIARGALPVSIPSDRFWQLRRVAEVLADGMVFAGEESVLQRICDDLDVSKKVARNLLAEYRTLFRFEELSEDALSMAWGGDPAREYDHRMRRELAVKLLDEVLRPRERNMVVYHLGIGQPRAMTFEELAARLNYNDPSAAEKAYRRAVRKLREHRDEGELSTWIWAARAIRETMQAIASKC